MEPQLAIGLIVGLLIGGAGVGISMGVVAHNNYQKYLAMKALAFQFEENWLDALEGNTDRRWIMRADGAEDPYVVRGRPDMDEARQRASSQLSEEDAIDLTWAAE